MRPEARPRSRATRVPPSGVRAGACAVHALGTDCMHHASDGGDHGDIGRANESPTRAGAPRIRRLTVDVSEDDLRTLAERGYEGAGSSDHDKQAQAVGVFLNDSLLQM